MQNKPSDIARQARQMAATAKCLEVLATLESPEERQQVVFGLVLATLDQSPRSEKLVTEVLERMMQKVAKP